MNKKLLKEKLEQAKASMKDILDKATQEEQRALTVEETEQFEQLKKECEEIRASIKAIEDMEEEERNAMEVKQKEVEVKKDEVVEERSMFDAWLRGLDVEQRADFTKGANGAVIPTTIADEIVKKVKEVSPVLTKVKMYNVKGTLSIPKYNGQDAVAFTDEMQKLDGNNAGAFEKIDLIAYAVRAIAKVSRQLVNNAQFDIVGFVVEDIAEQLAAFLEKQVLIGTSGKTKGAVSTTNAITAAAENAVTADELIALTRQVSKKYRSNAVFVVNPSTMTELQKLKDGDGNHLLCKDFRSGFGDMILGYPVYESDAMDEMKAKKPAIVFADFTGVAVNMPANIEIDVLREKYADVAAIGVAAYCEFACAVQNEQKVAVLKMK